jgi:hypothetical protein
MEPVATERMRTLYEDVPEILQVCLIMSTGIEL